MRSLTYAVILAAIWFPATAVATPRFIPDCAGSEEIAKAHVVRVEKSGALMLDDGRTVMLEGIRLPGADEPLAGRAVAALGELALAGPVTFTAISSKQDRYGRLRAQGFGDSWFQLALLDQGLARVAISPDRNECAPDLYEAEQQARQRHAGLWALPDSQPRRPEAMKAANIGSFQIVEGRVSNVGHNAARVFIDFGGGGARVFSAVVQPDDRSAFRQFDLDGLQARRIRIRGIVENWHGQIQIALSNPAQIEVLN